MKARKTLSLVLCAVLLVTMSVAGTLAYLTSQDTAVNTFSVGAVAIELWETKVDKNGDPVDGGPVKANDYHLLPGLTYTKDPTVTVKFPSENSYVRMLVTVSNIDALKEALPGLVEPTTGVFLLQELCYDENHVQTWNTDWEYYAGGYTEATVDGKKTATYEFRYKNIVNAKTGDNKLPALFTDITMPGSIDNIHLAKLEGMKIDVVAHAIQADGFTNAAEAWDSF